MACYSSGLTEEVSKLRSIVLCLREDYNSESTSLSYIYIYIIKLEYFHECLSPFRLTQNRFPFASSSMHASQIYLVAFLIESTPKYLLYHFFETSIFERERENPKNFKIWRRTKTVLDHYRQHKKEDKLGNFLPKGICTIFKKFLGLEPRPPHLTVLDKRSKKTMINLLVRLLIRQ